MKDIKIKCKLFILAVAIVFCTLSYRTTVKAIQINSKAKIDIGEEISRSGQSRKNTMMFGG